MLNIRLFSSLEVVVEDQVVDLGPQLRRFFGYLVLNAGNALDRKTLGEAIWGKATTHKKRDERMENVRQALHRLGTKLGSEIYRLQSGSGTICFDASGANVDVLRFQELIQHNDISSLEEAAKLYRGELLEEWEELWLESKRLEKQNQYRDVLRIVVEAAFQDKNHRKAIDFLLQNGLPRFEWAWEALILARLEAGERGEALGDYRNYLDFLSWESKRRGVTLAPSEELEDRIKSAARSDHRHRITGVKSASDTVFLSESAPLLPLEPIGGGVPLDSPYYIARSQDAKLTARLLNPMTCALESGQTLLIKGPRQIGKTSLLHRALHQAKQTGAQILLSDWQNLAQSDLVSDEAFFYALADLFAYQLQLDVSPEEAFRSRRGASTKFDRFVRDQILARTETPLVWGIDEADRIFSCDFRQDVYGKLRAWHNERSDTSSLFRRLTVILAYSTEAHLFIRDIHMSPFNIGETIKLHDLTLPQVAELNRRYGGPMAHSGDIEQLYTLTEGHPYLVRRCLHAIRQDGMGIGELERQAEHDDGIFADHLARIRFALSIDEELKTVVHRAIREGTTPSEADFIRLCASGLMRGERPAAMRPRCRLYELFLNRHLR